MAEYVWVARPDGWGDEAVDLHQCRRFLLSHPDWEWADQLAEYFLLPDGRWVSHKDMSGLAIKSRLIQALGEVWGFAGPLEVCNDFLFYRGDLPPDLTDLQEIRLLAHEVFDWHKHHVPPAQIAADQELSKLYQELSKLLEEKPMPFEASEEDLQAREETLALLSKYIKLKQRVNPKYWAKWYPHMTDPSHQGEGSDEADEFEVEPVLRPKWDKESRTIRIGEAEWHILKRRAPNVEAVLDRFESGDWPTLIRNPLGLGHAQLKDTKKYLNRKFGSLGIPMIFEQSRFGLRWGFIKTSSQ